MKVGLPIAKQISLAEVAKRKLDKKRIDAEELKRKFKGTIFVTILNDIDRERTSLDKLKPTAGETAG